MGANDTPTTTRSVVTDYFDWRLNNQIITNNRLFLIVRRIASESEAAYRSQRPTVNLHCTSLHIGLETLNNIKSIHDEIAREMFNAEGVSWSRIITFIAFSAILAEHTIQQQPDSLSPNFITSSIIDWTTDFIDSHLQTWLQSQNYWAGCLKFYDKPPQRRNSIGRYAGILGTIGMLTLGAFYMRRT